MMQISKQCVNYKECCSVTQSCQTLCHPVDCSTLGLPVPHHLLKFAQVHVHSIGDAIQLSHPQTPSSSAHSVCQHQGLFQWVGCSRQSPKYQSFSISLSNDYSGLISFKIDWFDLLSVQGTLRSLLYHHSLKASVLWRSAFFTVQLSQPYVTTGKAIALTLHTFVGRVISLLFNILSRYVIAFLPRGNCLITSTVILEPKKRKSVTASPFPPSICHELMEPGAVILVFFFLLLFFLIF